MNRLRKHILKFLYHISPKLNVRAKFLFHYNYYKKTLSFSNPETLDEKIQWMKIYYYKDNPLVSQCADKYAVREYVGRKGCGDILNDLYAAYDTVEEIDWDSIPNKFVMKWNFGAGHNLICRDKSKLDFGETKRMLNSWKKDHKSFHMQYSELQYKSIKPKLICEKLIETEDGRLPVDYKIYCFNGKAMYLMLAFGRETGNTQFYIVDRDWELQRLNKSGLAAPNDFKIPKPIGYEQLFKYAEILSEPFPFVRADFYLEDGKVIFGELTFTPSGGNDTKRLIEANKLYGSLVDLSDIKKLL